jgi:hypothetical protein
MSPLKRYAKKQAHPREGHRFKAHERLERDARQAQRAVEALHQPDLVVTKTVGMIFPRSLAAGHPWNWVACEAGSVSTAVVPYIGQEPGHPRLLAIELGIR